ncbi:GlxA family transcriptional regulator [Dactylosporangium sp. McL0621]|uniref:GlxA family transcriptional regulator n=1 Tax=Dactylosporangium sp. McL0621 TaxID=3415678 RepID=UPI003CFB4D42
MAFQKVAAYAPAGAAALGLGMASAAFRARPGLTGFDFAVCADRRGPVTTDLGVPVLAEHGPGLLERADLVLVLPGAEQIGEPAPRLRSALRRAHARGATVAAHCLGVFALAASGLLDGREATTHWQHAGTLAARHPDVTVRAERLYVDQGRIATGAGAAAGLDLYLHLIRRDHGAGLANAIARLLVVPPHREGGQRQYVDVPVADGGETERLAEVVGWARAHLHERLTLDALAARALMSRRSFIRYFKAATGTTPHAWLRAQRLNLAEELLETTDLSTERIAERTGYRSAAVLREQFARRRGLPPRDYRRAFTRR